METKQVVLAGIAMLAASAVAIAGPTPAGGTISGKVTYEGTPAKMKPIDMSKEPSCAKMYPTPQLVETVVTGPGNSLENVVVYVSAGVPDECRSFHRGGVHAEGLPLYSSRFGVSGKPGIEDCELRPDLSQHPPASEVESGVEQVAATGNAAHQREV